MEWHQLLQSAASRNSRKKTGRLLIQQIKGHQRQQGPRNFSPRGSARSSRAPRNRWSTLSLKPWRSPSLGQRPLIASPPSRTILASRSWVSSKQATGRGIRLRKLDWPRRGPARKNEDGHPHETGQDQSAWPILRNPTESHDSEVKTFFDWLAPR